MKINKDCPNLEDKKVYCPEWSKIFSQKTPCMEKNCAKYKTYSITMDESKPEELTEISVCRDMAYFEVVETLGVEFMRFNDNIEKMVRISEIMAQIEETQDHEEETAEAPLYG
jgi:hypothetical protein